jgi:hypothetical protein
VLPHLDNLHPTSFSPELSRRRARDSSAAAARLQLLSEWRVAAEALRVGAPAGIKSVHPECFSLLQAAFHAHAAGLLERAAGAARHRQAASRRAPGTTVTSDPRREVGVVERREKAKAEAKEAAERERLLKLAESRRADDDTKERAQKAKAEMQGKAQAQAADAVLSATLGAGSKWTKWAEGGGGGGVAVAKKVAGAKAKKVAEGDLAAAAAAKGREEGHTTTSLAGEGGAEEEAGARGAAGRAAASRGRGGGAGGEEAEAVRLKDIVAALEGDPRYRGGQLLYGLMNGVV